MELLGLPFIVRAPETAELAPDAELSPKKNLRRIVYAKLTAAAEFVSEDDIVIAADTVVILDGEYYGKPRDAQGAARMLRALSGRTHSVYTGAAAARGGVTEFICERTLVTFRRLTARDIARYIERRNPLDKAGAYGIQDSDFAERIDGDFYNIMGLPLGRVRALLYNMMGASAISRGGKMSGNMK
jgi:septum formation protein